MNQAELIALKTRALAAQAETDAIEPILRALIPRKDHVHDINVSESNISYRYDYSSRGEWDTDYESVSWLQLIDPVAYDAEQKRLAENARLAAEARAKADKKAAVKLRAQVKKAKEAKERAEYKRLKARFES